jgi:hypothetical protein
MHIVFTNHCMARMVMRKISREEVIEVIRCPDTLLKRHGKHYYRKNFPRGMIEVACEKTQQIKAITAYWI